MSDTNTTSSTAVEDAPPDGPAGSGGVANRRPLALFFLLLGTFMGMVDLFIVNVAAPSVQADLGATFGDIQMIVAGYTLAYAVSLVIAGRVGDAWGRRTVFLGGVIAFGLTSAACALAPTAGALIGARVAQGLSAAFMLAQVLALVQVLYRPDERARPLGYYGMAICAGAVAGQVLGGLLVRLDVAGLGWRTIFLVNVPICVIAVIGATISLPAAERGQRTSLDLVGVVLLAVGLLCLMYPIVVAAQSGWTAPDVVAIVLTAPVLAAFVLWERSVVRRGATPLLPPRMFRNRGFARGAATSLFFYSGNTGLVLMLSYYVQDGLHQGALSTGAVFVPMALASAVASLNVGRLTARFGPSVVRGAGLLLIVGDLGVWAAASFGSAADQLWLLLPGLVVAGLGQGCIAPSLLRLSLTDVAVEDAGAASGGLLTATQIANALGIVALGGVFTALAADGSIGHAFGMSLLLLCGLAVLVLVLLAVMTASERNRAA